MSSIKNLVLRLVWTGQFRARQCSHVADVPDAPPQADVCEGCVATGDTWPALRACLTCGFVGCCDKAKNRHAQAHYRETGHPVIRPYREAGMDWVWCYVDSALLDPEAVGRQARRGD